MSFLLLTNTVGRNAESIETFGSLVEDGYKAGAIMAAPRSRLVSTGKEYDFHTVTYNCESTTVTHCVVQGAWWFKNGLNASTVEVVYGPALAVDSSTTIANMELVGPERQDWVKPIARTANRFGVKFNHSTDSMNLYGKVLFASAFNFDSPPQQITVQKAEERVRPLIGHQQYQTEKAITLRFDHVTPQKMEAFKALPLQWPFFLYDEDADIFDHKLEHVIISEAWDATRHLGGDYTLELPVRRLKYYEVD